MSMVQLGRGKYLGCTKRAWDFGGVVVSETEYRSPVYEGWHCHENEHISFLLAGGTRELRKRRDQVSTAGALVFYRSGEMHRNVGTRHPSRNLNIEIEPAWLDRSGLGSGGFEAIAARPDEARVLVAAIYRECLAGDALSRDSVHQLMLSLLSLAEGETAGRRAPRWESQVRDALNDRWDENLSLGELAAMAEVHPVTLCRGFSRRFGRSLGEYARRVRVGKAIELLRREGPDRRSLAEIAHACGFHDQSHFIRVFRRLTGFRPGEFENA